MDEGVTNSYEAMKQELIEADKYGFLEWVESASGFLDFVITHSSGVQFRTMSYEGSLELAYQHLQEKKRLAALEDFVKEMAESYKHDSDALEKLVDKARELVE